MSSLSEVGMCLIDLMLMRHWYPLLMARKNEGRVMKGQDDEGKAKDERVKVRRIDNM